jgi:hypothetical protein
VGISAGISKADLLRKSKLHKDASDALKAAIGVYEGFFNKLSGPDDKGQVPLVTVIREDVLADVLAKDGSLLLVVKLQKSGGSYYTKRNLWTIFTGMQFYCSGGVVVSYALLQGNDGLVIASGLIPVLGGFVREGKLEETINGGAKL